MNKRELSEADICAKFITPHVEGAGWDDATQIRREVYFTEGQIHVRGKMVTRGKRKFADYVLYYKPNIPIAIIEAKENNRAVGDGMQQALEYAEILNIPFVFSSNGDGFVFHDRVGDLLVVITGDVGYVAIWDQDLGEAYVSQHVALVKPFTPEISRWLLLCLMAPRVGRRQLRSSIYGGKPASI